MRIGGGEKGLDDGRHAATGACCRRPRLAIGSTERPDGEHGEDERRLDDRDERRGDAGIALHRAGARLERAEQTAAVATTRHGSSRASSATAMAVYP